MLLNYLENGEYISFFGYIYPDTYIVLIYLKKYDFLPFFI